VLALHESWRSEQLAHMSTYIHVSGLGVTHRIANTPHGDADTRLDAHARVDDRDVVSRRRTLDIEFRDGHLLDARRRQGLESTGKGRALATAEMRLRA